MASNASSEPTTGTREVDLGEMRLEVVVLPVSDVDRAKHFYVDDAGVFVSMPTSRPPTGFRVVQVTPPGSPCSIIFGTGVTAGAPARSRT